MAHADITVVITNFKRPHNVEAIIERLRRQTLPCEIFLWDNSGRRTGQPKGADWTVQSSRNLYCNGRWWMAAQAGTEFAIVMDDDLAPATTLLLDATLRAARRNADAALGATGVILQHDRAYMDCIHVGLQSGHPWLDTRVDIVKGRFFCAATRRLRALAPLTCDCEDDIIVSAALAAGRQTPHLVSADLQGHLQELPDDLRGRFYRADHARRREAARRAAFT